MTDVIFDIWGVPVDESEIDCHIKEPDWLSISQHVNLSERFIRKYKDNVNWCMISMYQKLSEDFIREFCDRVYWWQISAYQQ